MTDIIRTPTVDEKKDFENIAYKEETALSKFYEEMGKAQQVALKKGLPFAEKAATDDFKDYYDQVKKENVRRNGYLVASEIKPLKLDFAKYSDLKNFELVEETEVSDAQLAKQNPGLDIKIAQKKYKYKGYGSHVYFVMEDPQAAIKRAQKKKKEE